MPRMVAPCAALLCLAMHVAASSTTPAGVLTPAGLRGAAARLTAGTLRLKGGLFQSGQHGDVKIGEAEATEVPMSPSKVAQASVYLSPPMTPVAVTARARHVPTSAAGPPPCANPRRGWERVFPAAEAGPEAPQTNFTHGPRHSASDWRREA